jgi:hypothetical protein
MNSPTELDQSLAIAPNACPKCGFLQNRTEQVTMNKRDPRAGDISICVECSALCFFTDSLGHLRAATWADIRELEKTPRLFNKVCEIQRELRAAWHARHPESGLAGRKFRRR